VSSRTYEVVVVGGGITGLSIAWHLAERHAGTIAIIERTGLGSGATSIQPGGFRQQWGNWVNCLLARESVAFYRELGQRLDVAVDPGFTECGYLFVAHSEAGTELLAKNVALQNSLGIPSRLVDPAEAVEIVPGLNGSAIVAASFCAEDGYFDRPQAVVGAFIDACARVSVDVVGGEVDRLDPDGTGWSVSLRDGRRLGASAVVVAAGYDSPALVAGLGLELPIRREPRYLFYSDPIHERLLEPLVVSPERHFASKQLADGSVLASDLTAGSDPSKNEEVWRGRLREAIHTLLPVLEYVSFPVLVRGFYDLTPDGLAIVGTVPNFNGLWLAAGQSGRGFMMAPAVGRLLADALVAGTSDKLLEALSVKRFSHVALTPEPQIV
jgi:sarcosine oxidase subunit beta